MFRRTTAVNKILSLKKRKKVIQGGTSASKTYSILAILIDKACKNPGLEISIVSETIPHLRRGALKDFLKIMQMTGRYIDSRYNRSLLTYTFANGSYIEFFSTDQEDRLRGARRNVLYVNEANNITFDAYHQLAIRTSSDIYIDFNPSEQFWAHTEVLTDTDSELLILTYLDNEALPENVVNDLNQAKEKAKTSSYWANWCRVYIDGQIGNLQGAVFENWTQCSEIPKDATFIAYGMDFGFTNDPTTLVGVWKFNSELYIKEFIYETKLTNQDICVKLKALNVSRSHPIIADSAEPKSIEEIRRGGFSIQPAAKGQDSIRASISTLQQFKINVTSDSINIIKELRAYRWETNKTGEAQKNPIDAYNHSIDALRYVALNRLKSGYGKYSLAY